MPPIAKKNKPNQRQNKTKKTLHSLSECNQEGQHDLLYFNGSIK